ncbi:cytochrome c oxidase subunit 2A [Lottiidibacillus patelloidae]|uniref:Cytochrome c oxidase subunit 2A n=1 Tax=Lottiidibacillus patelloidae TaxID=2670334 RepID=A0A263BRI8_9BACI|nr:cytochrome c oxidase subunit 2A [Lottiidibacillus patelloidae]OZM55987.1 cytochrome c oxidase subunit 2A [Lottiidibacillus patelloidae]
MENKLTKLSEKTNIEVKSENDKKLKGTFLSVLALGGFIVLSWLTVYFLFISRM